MKTHFSALCLLLTPFFGFSQCDFYESTKDGFTGLPLHRITTPLMPFGHISADITRLGPHVTLKLILQSHELPPNPVFEPIDSVSFLVQGQEVISLPIHYAYRLHKEGETPVFRVVTALSAAQVQKFASQQPVSIRLSYSGGLEWVDFFIQTKYSQKFRDMATCILNI